MLERFGCIYDSFRQVAENKKNDKNSSFYQCMLGTSHIRKNLSLIRDKHFLNGVMKMQRGNSEELTASEKLACKKPLCPSETDLDMQDNATSDEDDIMKEIVSEMKKKNRQVGQFMNTNS